MKNIVILISGRGSNMEALIAARDAGNLPVNIVAVISNRPDAAGLETRLMNIHPSLLPSFPGLHTHQRALDEGVRIHGCTVHFVTPTLDHGPVIIQAAVPVLDSDNEASLAARVLRQEHQVYPQAVRWFAEGKLTLDNGRVRLAADLVSDSAFVSPVPR